MKNITYRFLALILLSCFISSCKKDDPIVSPTEKGFSEIDTDFNQILQLREDDLCVEIPELCPRVGIIHEPGPTGPGGPGGPIFGSESKIVFKDAELEYIVYPLESEEGTRSFAVETKELQMVISDTENELFTTFSEETIEIPNCILKVFEMDHDKWTQGTLTVEDVQTSYDGRPVYEDSERDYLVIEDDFLTYSDPDCPPPTRRITKYFWCEWRNSSTANAIVNNLMKDIPMVVQNASRFTIRKAVAKCAEETDNCFECIPQNCILNEIRSTLDDDLGDKMRENFLQLYLRLDDLQFAALKSNTALFNQYLNFYGLKSPVECAGDCLHAVSASKLRLELATGQALTQAEIDKLCEIYTSTNMSSAKYNCLKKMGSVIVDNFMLTATKEEIEVFLSIPGCNKEALELAILYVVEARGPQIDLAESFKECFGDPDSNGDHIDCNDCSVPESCAFNFTLYADQPVNGTREVLNREESDPGHTFVSLTATIGGISKTIVFGYYPETGVHPITGPSDPGVIIDDSGHTYDSALSFELDCNDFNLILNNAIDLIAPTYNLNSFNCTDYGIGLGNSQGCCIPDTYRFWGVGGGSNPADLGADMPLYTEHENTLLTGPADAPDTDCL